MKSINFQFLEKTDPILVTYAASAERYVLEDPEAALMKLRKLAEFLALQAAAYSGLYTNPDATFAEVLGTLKYKSVAPPEVIDIFHAIRISGNQAAHGQNSDLQTIALRDLKLARTLSVWFHQTFKDHSFKAKAFVPPPRPVDASKDLISQLEEMKNALELKEQETQKVKVTAEQTELRLQEAEQKAKFLYEEQKVALQLAEETEAKLKALTKQYEQQLRTDQKTAEKLPPKEVDSIISHAKEAANNLDITEAETRRIIDQQLRESGWEVDTQLIRYSKGVRPQKGKNIAIAEWPTETGPADYILFCGLTPIATVEAKRSHKNVSAVIGQAERYSRGYKPAGTETLATQVNEYKIPFVFSTNGKSYFQPLAELSGIWFRDTRRANNHSHPLVRWRTPEGLKELLELDVDKADTNLLAEPKDYLPLYPFQRKAIEAVEKAVVAGQANILLAMATGTGKTRVAICMIYRFLKAKRFKRILFLVDRTALGIQAADRLKELQIEDYKTFPDIYDVKELGDIKAEAETKLHISTIQSVVKRIFSNDNVDIPVDEYDCIVVDECHRGYTLDRELTDTELEFRETEDYISKYRRALEYFDAVKIGLTATPALHTVEIFGRPVLNYTYREAVIDGFLVDHEPPIRITTNQSVDGITWAKGETIEVVNIKSAQLELFNTPDEVHVEIEKFNKTVITENFNKAVLGYLAKEIDPQEPGKTIIFCATDIHADLVVRVLKDAFKHQYGDVANNAVEKITSARGSEVPGLIKKFKNEKYPNIAVTVDLLSTGIDVPEITNIVFLRRVKSRILYEQMLGRATRLCDNLYGPGQKKECFRIFDAVDLYEALEEMSSMKPVVVNPNLSFEQLIKDLENAPDEDSKKLIKDQILAKLQRRKRAMSEAQTDKFKTTSGETPQEFTTRAKDLSPEQVLSWFKDNNLTVGILDLVLAGDGTTAMVSHHEDGIRQITHGYGNNLQPDDYLEAFKTWLNVNSNRLPALQVVTQRPRELTREQLKQIAIELDSAGYTELNLRTAWREKTNRDIAASIIGYIRTLALGSPLVAYEERVNRAIQKTLAKAQWTNPQRKWIERIGKQLLKEVVVDKAALSLGQFQAEGGFNRINKIFDGTLEQLLGDINEELWREVA